MRRELSVAFGNLLKKIFSKKQLSEMSDIPDSYNNTLNQSENQDYLSIFDNKAEKLTLSLFIKSHLSDESYLSELDLSRDKLEFLTSPFDEGKQSGLQTPVSYTHLDVYKRQAVVYASSPLEQPALHIRIVLLFALACFINGRTVLVR